MKQYFLLSLFFTFSLAAHAQPISLEEHLEWSKGVADKCNAISNVSKSIKCQVDLIRDRKEEGLYRGTANYIETAYSDASVEDLQSLIDDHSKRLESAPAIRQAAETGELTVEDYQIEIYAAEKLIRNKQKEIAKDK
jgi:hypothetical protein